MAVIESTGLDPGHLETRKFQLLQVSVNWNAGLVYSAFAVKAFYKDSDSFVSAQRAICCEFNLHSRPSVPSSKAIALWIKNFEATDASTTTKKAVVRK